MVATDTSPDRPARLVIVGTGYVGLTTGACFAHLGHHVVCADIDEAKVAKLRAGQIPIVEAGLAELVHEGVASGRLSFVVGAANAVTGADAVFLCVPTPQGEDGGADLHYVEDASAEIAAALEPGTLVVNKSTVPVGSTRVVEAVLRRDDVFVLSNPEFLREGTAVHDFLHPDRVVIGCDDREAGHRLATLYDRVRARVIVTDPASAETIKYAANGFLAMKISFINAVAAMCEDVGATIDDVVDGIGSDNRIGSAFLRPGPGWGGSCFPKDSHALVKIAADHGYEFALMRGVIAVNDEQRRRMVAKVRAAAGVGPAADLGGVVIAVLGLTFKGGTDDRRDSPSVAIIQELLHAGATVRAHDPTVPARSELAEMPGLHVVADPYEAATEADVLVIGTDWPEYGQIDLDRVGTLMRGKRAVVDTRNMLEPCDVRSRGLYYDGVGRP